MSFIENEIKWNGANCEAIIKRPLRKQIPLALPSHTPRSSKPTKTHKTVEKLLLKPPQQPPSSYCRDISRNNLAKSRRKCGRAISTPSGSEQHLLFVWREAPVQKLWKTFADSETEESTEGRHGAIEVCFAMGEYGLAVYTTDVC